MGKSLRSKRKKGLRAIRRDIVEPFYDKKEATRLAAQEAALAQPKLQIHPPPSTATDASTSTANTNMDVGMADGSQSMASLKPIGRVGKKSKKGKGKHHGKGKLRRKHSI